MDIQMTHEENVIADGVEYMAREAFGTDGCPTCEIHSFCPKNGYPPCLPWERKDQRDIIFIKKEKE